MKSNLHDALKPFAARAGQIRMFDLLLLDVLPRNLLGRLRVLNVRDGVLVIGVDHAALATQTRFQAPQWLDRLNQAARKEGNLPPLTNVEIRVASEERLLKPPEKKHRELGESARASLRTLAEHEPDASLASTLRRLAELGTKPTSDEN
jgi:hypothetical protein